MPNQYSDSPVTVTRICATCGQRFISLMSRLKEGRGRYCSKKCLYERNGAAEDVLCHYCRQSFKRSPSVASKGKGKYCSRSCSYSAKINNSAHFWSKVDRSGGPDACWLWLRSTSGRGYGRIQIDGEILLVHRVSWEITNGPIPDGLFVLHNCPTGDNPRCCNPSHLWLGTHTDNMMDRNTKGRQARGERLKKSDLTAEMIVTIRQRHAAGESLQSLAEAFSVNKTTIGKITRRESWHHI